MVTTIINYCTNDYRFLNACISEVSKFSQEVVVPVCDHFFDGTPENQLLLEHSYAAHPDVKFIEFALENEGYGIYSSLNNCDPDWIHYLHSTARYVGYQFLHPETKYVLFLDVDEIIDGDKMKAWLQNYNYQEYNAVRFTSYFYFREARFRATKIMRNALLVKRANFDSQLILDINERKGTFDAIIGPKLEDVRGLDGTPLVHHYSWVKTTDEMHKKVQSWGHHKDCDWVTLIQNELKAPFNLKDQFWGFDYSEVQPFTDPLQVKIPDTHPENCNFHTNLIKINRKSLIQKMILTSL